MHHPERRQIAGLRETLANRFNKSSLQDLCLDMDISYEDLSGETLSDKVRELILYCDRHDRLPELLTYVKQSRPDIDWDAALSAQPTQPASAGDPEVLRARRSHYEALYRILKPLARYDLPEPLSIEVLQQITIAMRDWYFDGGGLYLSNPSRKPYFDLKETIKLVRQDPRYDSAHLVLDEDSELLLKSASTLRAALRDDLGVA